MRSKYYFSAFLICLLGFVRAQTTVSGSFVHGGITRTYSCYVPASYVPGTPVPMVIGLHGLSSSGSDFAQYRDFRPIADTANFIVVNPDGSTILGIKFWNYGNIMGSTVDDVGFLEALIDTISAQYAINSSRVYCTGMSNGSFMAYLLACQSDRFAAIGAVTGSMSVDMYNTCAPVHPIPVIHIHGTDDNTNPYDGTSTMKGIDEVVSFWVDQNNCTSTPATTSIPDINTSDNATASRYLYSGGMNGHTVELFKVTGGGHAWPGSPMPGSSENTCMDFDARKEIWRFFSQYEKTTASVASPKKVALNFWPNPTSDEITIQIADDYLVTELVITDLEGRVIERKTGENIQNIYLNQLKAGNYLLQFSGEGFRVLKKVVILNK